MRGKDVFGRLDMLNSGRYESFIVIQEFLSVHLLEIFQKVKSGSSVYTSSSLVL
jgi:hypothetical protein